VIFVETELAGVWRIALDPRVDDRGFFARAFCRREFEAHGLPGVFVQANLSFNHRRGTLRGMHLQLEPHAETKLVRCTRGAIFDAVVDLRPASPTFARWTAAELSAAKGQMLLVPRGFGHGYLTLADDTEVFYQVTEEYHPENETGIRWNDPTVAIRWPFAPTSVSERDETLPDLPTFRARLANSGTSG
jgi:dTDP-4-dehydrorhamnose 3,5-epimerase